MNERYIIDRIEDKFAIVEKENGDMYKISVNSIRGNFEEGDILINKDEYFEIDKNFTLNRKKEMDEIMKDMWKE
ncbi:hypothetical protein CDLVIII_5716 [Clostridium sp. DL-VIII]|uniref:DUF3006 domain-containing protein n=1 Tax=Clostridium sp. DL-VIII TaxID=641107 RepID=UPI00023B07FF|nr:DUF3006 domain-containing protein [Clostridium sp. DL-VIII]EHJ02184.1 hypothetical protein CDLVIII_5716 [Clostridium sp. DL-VIII]